MTGFDFYQISPYSLAILTVQFPCSWTCNINDYVFVIQLKDGQVRDIWRTSSLVNCQWTNRLKRIHNHFHIIKINTIKLPQSYCLIENLSLERNVSLYTARKCWKLSLLKILTKPNCFSDKWTHTCSGAAPTFVRSAAGGGGGTREPPIGIHSP